MKTERLPRMARAARRLRARAPARPTSGPALEAHLEGCAECRAEADVAAAGRAAAAARRPGAVRSRRRCRRPSWASGSRRRSRASSEQQRERRQRRRVRRLRPRRRDGGAAAAVLAIVVFPAARRRAPSSTSTSPRCRRGSRSTRRWSRTPTGPRSTCTSTGSARGRSAASPARPEAASPIPAGTFRYRWGDDSDAVLSSALDLSRTRAIVRPRRRPHLRRAGRTRPARGLRSTEPRRKRREAG